MIHLRNICTVCCMNSHHDTKVLDHWLYHNMNESYHTCPHKYVHSEEKTRVKMYKTWSYFVENSSNHKTGKIISRAWFSLIHWFFSVWKYNLVNTVRNTTFFFTFPLRIVQSRTSYNYYICKTYFLQFDQQWGCWWSCMLYKSQLI